MCLHSTNNHTCIGRTPDVVPELVPFSSFSLQGGKLRLFWVSFSFPRSIIEEDVQLFDKPEFVDEEDEDCMEVEEGGCC